MWKKVLIVSVKETRPLLARTLQVEFSKWTSNDNTHLQFLAFKISQMFPNMFAYFNRVAF